MLQAMTTMESEIMLWVQEYLRRDWLDPIWIAVTTLGNGGMIWILLSVGLLIPKKTRKTGMLALLALAFSYLINNLLLKNLIARTRPYEVICRITYADRCTAGLFFPVRPYGKLFCSRGGTVLQTAKTLEQFPVAAGFFDRLFQVVCRGALSFGYNSRCNQRNADRTCAAVDREMHKENVFLPLKSTLML